MTEREFAPIFYVAKVVVVLFLCEFLLSLASGVESDDAFRDDIREIDAARAGGLHHQNGAA